MEYRQYPNTQAVKDVLAEWTPGTDLHGPEIVSLAYDKLRQHGSPAKPMDASIMRYVRYYGCLYGVRLKKRSTSLYHKESPRQKTVG